MDEMHGLYTEIGTHLLSDPKPSDYLKEIYNHSLMKHYPFDMLHQLKHTHQSPKHHPEGDVWNHTLLVTDMAAQMKNHSKDAEAFMWAALLHDIGKPPTTKIRKGRITSYSHDKLGAKMAGKFLSFFTDNKQFIENVSMLVRYHMHILFVVNQLPYADLKGLKKNTDVNEVALLGFCDRAGRKDADPEAEKKRIECFRRMCE